MPNEIIMFIENINTINHCPYMKIKHPISKLHCIIIITNCSNVLNTHALSFSTLFVIRRARNYRNIIVKYDNISCLIKKLK